MSGSIDRIVISGDGLTEEQAWALAHQLETEFAAGLSPLDAASTETEHIQTAPVQWDGDAGGLARGIAGQVMQAIKG